MKQNISNLERSEVPHSFIVTDNNGIPKYVEDKNEYFIPIPLISLGENYELQHNRLMSINDLMSNTYTSTNKGNSISQKGVDWANGLKKIGISFSNNECRFFLENKPMIFLEVYNPKGNRKRRITDKKGDSNSTQWIHPTNKDNALNRIGSNYGNGMLSKLKTEWDLVNLTPYSNQEIEINPSDFYYNFQDLPQRKVDWSFNNENQLTYIKRRNLSGGNLNKTLSYRQPFRFRFAYIDPKDKKSVILGNPSDTLILSPKGGYFKSENDYYWYDFQIKFK